MSENNQQDARELEQALSAMDRTSPIYTQLSVALSAGISLYILEFAEHNGPTGEDQAKAKTYLKDFVERGADLYFRSKREGGTADRYDQAAYTIAVLSFCKGGITIFGRHYDGRKMQERFYQQKQQKLSAFDNDNIGTDTTIDE